MMRRLLSTKILAPSLQAQLQAAGIELIEKEAISVTPCLDGAAWQKVLPALSGGSPVVVFTSSNAVNAVAPFLETLPNGTSHWQVFSIAGRTAEALKDLRLPTPLATAWNGKALAELMTQHHPIEVYFFCGASRRDELPQHLQAAGITVQEVIAYTTVATPFTAPQNLSGILFFSPSGVQSFFENNRLPEGLPCFAIGETTAAALHEQTSNTVVVSPLPTQEALLRTAIQFLNGQDDAVNLPQTNDQ
jgi:uroporphyrinogen-III synthase